MREFLCRVFGHQWNVRASLTPVATLSNGGVYAVCLRCHHGQTLWFDHTP